MSSCISNNSLKTNLTLPVKELKVVIPEGLDSDGEPVDAGQLEVLHPAHQVPGVALQGHLHHSWWTKGGVSGFAYSIGISRYFILGVIKGLGYKGGSRWAEIVFYKSCSLCSCDH